MTEKNVDIAIGLQYLCILVFYLRHNYVLFVVILYLTRLNLTIYSCSHDGGFSALPCLRKLLDLLKAKREPENQAANTAVWRLTGR